MSSEASTTFPVPATLSDRITAIVPARNEESVIAACVESLALQPEITEIFVIDDQSADRTAATVRGLAARIPHLRLLQTTELPLGWTGKNNAAALGARAARNVWLLFTDADAVLESKAAAKALEIARDVGAGLVSFSPQQITTNWYEKALIPFLYCRLARKFSFATVNDPHSGLAAANGQFLMIHREAYEAIGGHASVASEVLEDVAIAKRIKAAKFFIYFGSGTGLVRVRMYRSFSAMWEGWRKNLYQLIGGTPKAVFGELAGVIPWVAILALLVGLKYPMSLLAGVLLLLMRQTIYGGELRRNQYPYSLILYYVPAVALYGGVLLASWRSHARGKVSWKGREYSLEPSGTLK
ncbi:MAG TPA: glycosyltransferase family A protein [Candidatus Saccharimonadales bacterium]|nr:glycosyltransferase family A protein [Candidatus Saccharimonadales bacterium]